MSRSGPNSLASNAVRSLYHHRRGGARRAIHYARGAVRGAGGAGRTDPGPGAGVAGRRSHAPRSLVQAAVPGYPDVKVVPVDTSPAAKQSGDGDIQHQLSANLTGAGYTNVKIMPDAFIVQATNKSGKPVMMFLSPDSLTVFTAVDAKGQDARTAPAGSAPADAAK
jgi:hypothetical protein